MYAFAFCSILLASTALAAPKPIDILPQPHFGRDAQLEPQRRDMAYSSAAYGVLAEPTATSTATVVNTVTASTLVTSSSTIAIPSSTSSPTPEPVEEQAGVYICDDVNWGGKCQHKLSPVGSADEDCTQLDGKASSIGPDVGFYCLFFTNSYCRPLLSDGSDTLNLTYPGNANLLLTENGNFNDKIYSYECFQVDPLEAVPTFVPSPSN